ncbi:hypothetical protein [Rheinheimera sp.]|uniref:hypothetical protein n=1 Tax=Rheinheimera sp. TaxID=1869214 RepID=UPI00307DF59B
MTAKPDLSSAGPTPETQELLQQAMALFDMAPFQPVQLAFPAVISATAPPPEALQLDLQQLYASQEQLFTSPPAETTANHQPPSAAAPAEPHSVRQMFEPSTDG